MTGVQTCALPILTDQTFALTNIQANIFTGGENPYTVTQIKLSADGFAKKLNEQPSSAVQEIFRQYAGFELTDEELQSLYHCKGYKNSPIPENERSEKEALASLYSSSLNGFIAKLITSKTCFGFTTNGHTGEDVLLVAYHPAGTLPMGMHTNIELNHYYSDRKSVV